MFWALLILAIWCIGAASTARFVGWLSDEGWDWLLFAECLAVWPVGLAVGLLAFWRGEQP